MNPSPSEENPGRRLQRVLLPLLAAGFYLALCGICWVQIRKLNQGHFTYALDDPYIHLALSEGIAHGHYGINPNEFSSPSSSLIWPFLLAPFARFGWQLYVPLLLNIVAGVAAAVLAGAAVARWPDPPGAVSSKTVENWRRILSAAALVFVGNLVGLTYIGMEHTLQVFLAGAGAWAIIACLRGRPIPMWCLVCVAMAPMIRYENLAISVAVAIALFGLRQKLRALALLLASVMPLAMFSVYLHHLGLPLLPTSVLVKEQMAHAGSGAFSRALQFGEKDLYDTFAEPHRMLVTILFLTLLALAWKEHHRERRFALWGATVAAGLQLLVGRFHWFHRYEVYIVFFSVLILLEIVHERPRGLLGWYGLGLLGCSYLYILAFNTAPRSASQVYREQFQMHRFATEFYTGNVAVNDLGLVSFQRRSGTYVLDLWGLASVQAARQQNKSTAWLDQVVRAHDVGLVMYYPRWFSPAPADWTQLGQVCINEPPVALGDMCVAYYATPLANHSQVGDEFDDFVATLPPGVTVWRPDS